MTWLEPQVKLRDVLEYIEQHPEEWDQTSWGAEGQRRGVPACGTAYCFAGHASVTFAHDRPVWEARTGFFFDAGKGKTVEYTYRDFDYVTSPHTGNRQLDVHVRAAELLGLTIANADELFAANNNLHDLRVMVGKLESGENLSDYDEEDD